MFELRRPHPIYTQAWFLFLAFVGGWLLGWALMAAAEVVPRYVSVTQSQNDLQTTTAEAELSPDNDTLTAGD